jgi:hypothetical protein
MSPNRQKAGHPEMTPEVEIKNMKSLLFVSLVLCIFCAVGASGQVSGVLNAQPQMFEMPSHPQQASQQGMSQSHDIMERSASVWGQGEKPLWEAMQEMGTATAVTPLGDSARALRKDHAAVKKASIVWSN